jgi:hypothetical protein
MTTKFSKQELTDKDKTDIECMLSTLQDSQKEYQPKCTEEALAEIQNLQQSSPWCGSYEEMLTFNR